MKTTFQKNSPDWERRIVLELYREYRHTLRERRIEMRAAAIELSRSQSHWGQWDPNTQTIYISERLVLEYSWFQVVAVLRHEMAHQLLFSEAKAGQSGHGPLFKEACRRLGVPEGFRKAGADLQSSDPDWRHEKRDEVSERLYERAQKLLALANSSNENEASVAMNKVRELYARHSLDPDGQVTQTGFSNLVINPKKKRLQVHEQRIVGILVGHFFVEVVIVPLFDAQSGETHRAIEIIGSRANTQMAEYVYHFLTETLERLLKEKAKVWKLEKGGKFSPFQRKSFRLGVLAGFSEKLEQAEKGVQEGAARSVPSVIGQALVRVKEDAELGRYLSECFPRVRTQGSRRQYVEQDFFGQGKREGRKLNINRPLESKSQPGGTRFLLGKSSDPRFS